jgi:adenine-specific DNA-methyltransferase
MIAPPAERQNRASGAPVLNGEKSYQERMLEVLRRSPRLHQPGNRIVEFSGTLWLSAEAALINGENEPVAVVFGPEHGAVSDRLVYNAAVEAYAKQYVLLVVVGSPIEANARRMIDACLETCGIPAVYVAATPKSRSSACRPPRETRRSIK